MNDWTVRFVPSITAIGRQTWNAITGIEHPFTRYEFLGALELSGATTARTGWQVSHAVVARSGVPVAVMPLYIKSHSYGEYVFDFAWANAWESHGLDYYPKLVAAIPFTPVTGPRLCVAPGEDRGAVIKALLPAIDARMVELAASSCHFLFVQPKLADKFQESGVLTRRGVQFHWFNQDYSCFDDFLQRFNSRKRKAVRKERSGIAAQGITLQTYIGTDLSETLWDQFFTFYQMTYAKRSGHGGYLNREFFRQLGTSMSEHLVLVMASRGGRIVAGALSLRDADTLYGRYWGCVEDCANLHFEACYYQGIEFCIEHGLSRFDSGAQGEHKIQRGFEPVYTYSNHLIVDVRFKAAVSDFLTQEAAHTEGYRNSAAALLPYRQPDLVPDCSE
jgi:predicted N-acyltransferase